MFYPFITGEDKQGSGSFETFEKTLSDRNDFLDSDTVWGQMIMEIHDLTEEQLEHYRMSDPDIPHEIHMEIANYFGWYWQSGFPGCLPDGEPVGPFEDEVEAIADAWMRTYEETEELLVEKGWL